jgi:hypothetical protein
MEGVQDLERARMSDKVWTAGVLCAISGAGWLVNGVLSLVMSQPDGAAFAISGVFWIIIQLLLLIGVVGLALSGAAPGWFGGISLGIALLGRADFVAAEVRSLIIGYDSDLLPLGAMITAVGMTLVGIAVLRAKRWGGWQRFTPLLAGIYPFVVMFPFIFITDEPSQLAITGWGLLWLLLGYAIWSSGPVPHRAAKPERRSPVGTSK